MFTVYDFTVYDKENGKMVNVFHVSYDSSGYPTFLIYEGGEWKRVSAKHYKPIR